MYLQDDIALVISMVCILLLTVAIVLTKVRHNWMAAMGDVK